MQPACRAADLASKSLLRASQGTSCCRTAAGRCEATARFRDKTNTRRVFCLDEAMRTHDGSEKRGWMTDGVSPSVMKATAAGRVTAHCDASGRPDSSRTSRATRTTRVEGALSGRLPPNRGIHEEAGGGLDPVDKGTVFGITKNGSKHHGTRHRTRALISSSEGE